MRLNDYRCFFCRRPIGWWQYWIFDRVCRICHRDGFRYALWVNRD